MLAAESNHAEHAAHYRPSEDHDG